MTTTILTNEEVKKQSARRTRRSFLIGGLGVLGGVEFYRWVMDSKQMEMLPAAERHMFELNAKVSEGVFHERGLTPTYPLSKAVDLRVNGNYGLKQDLLPESYRLQVVGVDKAKSYKQYVNDVTAWEYRYKDEEAKYEGHDTKVDPEKEARAKMPPEFQKAFAEMDANNTGRAPRGQEEAGESDSTLDPGTPGLLLTLDEVTNFPKYDLVSEFKCIEGWSEIVHWTGVRLADFIAAYPPARNADGKLPRYVYMETPNGDYYTGYHLGECMHPQSLLATHMSGKPLPQVHGYPIRLHMPIKYGYKQIKRIGLIAYTDDEPDDYWTKLGYDWYAGL